MRCEARWIVRNKPAGRIRTDWITRLVAARKYGAVTIESLLGAIRIAESEVAAAPDSIDQQAINSYQDAFF